MGRRPARLGEAIREEVAQLVGYELADPRIGVVTVTRVEVSPDLGHARVHVSVLGDERERQQTLAALAHSSGFVRRELARRLGIRQVPEVDFRYDKGLEATERVATLLEEDRQARQRVEAAAQEDSAEERPPSNEPNDTER